jgi:phenylacetate-CoA ligase
MSISHKKSSKDEFSEHADSLFGLALVPPQPKRGGGFDEASRRLAAHVDHAFLEFSLADAQKQLTSDSEEVWLERGEKRALALFQAAAEHVPAYKDFLKKHDIDPAMIKTMENFQRVPLVDKENYLHAYPLEKLCWYGDIAYSQMISVSSGSSGQPFFWPRGQILDTETALEHELFLGSTFNLDEKSTLFIVCFAMGMYVAGPITMDSVLRMGEKGYPVTVVTPGYSPDDVLKIIPQLAPKYDQIVLAGYPPYIKEIIDQGLAQGINWSQIKVRFLLAGEGFNESWRTYVAELAGGQSPVHDFLNLYGSADAAVLAHETTASIVIRRRIFDDIEARKKLFKDERLPSLLQYHPEHKFFEVVDDELIFTATGGVPLIRYNIHDSGGVLTKQDFVKAVPEIAEYFDELERDQRLWNIPFVYVFGKSDQTAIVYGANVYPENIRRALEEEDVRQYCSGKILMYTDLDKNKDQRLYVEIECANGTKPTDQLTRTITTRILETLLESNSEYKVVNRGIGDRSIPIVRLYPGGDERFRSEHIKHKWTRNT